MRIYKFYQKIGHMEKLSKKSTYTFSKFDEKQSMSIL